MSTTREATIAARLADLHATIAEGRVLEAVRTFYTDDVVMQENTDPPCEGLAANLAREEAWLAGVKELTHFELVRSAVHGDVSFAETVMELVTTDGQRVRLAQVSRALWRGDRIREERFYHG